MIASFESMAQHKGVKLQFASSVKEQLCYLDPLKINSIFTNLLSNALKFTPRGGKVELAISGCNCVQHDHCMQKTGCLVLTVRDTGIGIPEDKIPYIFDRYYKVNNDSVNNSFGTGLGLTLVRELVNLHRGTIEVKSKVGEYTEFQLRFPMGKHHYKEEEIVDTSPYEIEDEFGIPELAAVNEEKEKEVVDPEVLNPRIILVIEDNKDMRTLIRTALKNEYLVIEAKNGEEGEKAAIETIPDMIISDVMMPKKDGFDVARSIKSNEITSHIPLILLTARVEMSDRLVGLETGADDYLVKPFYAKELRTRVKNLLHQRDRLKEKYSRLSLIKPDDIPLKSIDQAFLEKVVKVIESSLGDERFGVQELIREIGMSRTQLHRKLKALTNQSSNEFIQNIRLQRASEMLKNNTGTIAEIAYRVGFANPPYFTRAFKQHFGHTPSEHLGINS